MGDWRRRIRGAVLMGITWAVAWGSVGMAIELVHNVWPNALGRMVDIWPMALAMPAFICGVSFSVLLGVAARHRKFGELSLSRFAVLGAAGGALTSLAPVAIVLTGLGSMSGSASLFGFTASLIGPLAVLGGASAAGTLALARRGEDPAPSTPILEDARNRPVEGITPGATRTPSPSISSRSVPPPRA